jgi:hypothetical protein
MSRLVRVLLCNGALILIVGKFLFPVSAIASTFEVSGIISDPAGRPIAGANVELVSGNGIAAVGAVTGPAGRFQLSTESAGAYNLIVRSPGFRNASRVLAISLAAARYEVNLSLDISSVELSLYQVYQLKLPPAGLKRRSISRRALPRIMVSQLRSSLPWAVI